MFSKTQMQVGWSQASRQVSEVSPEANGTLDITRGDNTVAKLWQGAAVRQRQMIWIDGRGRVYAVWCDIRGDLNVLLSQTLRRPLNASWRLMAWGLRRCQVSTPSVTSVASTKPSSATWVAAGVWTRPTGDRSLEPCALDRPVAVKLSLVRQDNWLWIFVCVYHTNQSESLKKVCFVWFNFNVVLLFNAHLNADTLNKYCYH